MYKRWTKREKIYIVENFNNVTGADMARTLEVTPNRVYAMRHKLVGKKKTLSEKQVKEIVKHVEEEHDKKIEDGKDIELRRKFVERNHKKMTVGEMAEEWNCTYIKIYSDREALESKGKIKAKDFVLEKDFSKNKNERLETWDIDINKIIKSEKETCKTKQKIKQIEKSIRTGTLYHVQERNNKPKDRIDFKGKLLKTLDNFYLFETTTGYRECVLKTDFAIGDYTIEEA